MSIKKAVPYLLIILAVIALTFNFRQSSENKTITSPAALTVDFSIDKLRVKQFQNSGELLHTITANSASGSNQSMEMQHPKIVTFDNKEQWVIKADSAKTDNNHANIILEKNVLLALTGAEKQEPLSLTTDTLNYASSTQTVSTQSRVSLVDAEILLSGVGLNIDLKQQIYQLNSQVKGIRRNAQ